MFKRILRAELLPCSSCLRQQRPQTNSEEMPLNEMEQAARVGSGKSAAASEIGGGGTWTCWISIMSMGVGTAARMFGQPLG